MTIEPIYTRYTLTLLCSCSEPISVCTVFGPGYTSDETRIEFSNCRKCRHRKESASDKPRGWKSQGGMDLTNKGLNNDKLVKGITFRGMYNNC